MADDPRALARLLLGLPEVEGVELAETGVLVRARNPRRFFREFAGMVLEESLDVRRLETLDDSAQAILGYLLGGRGR
jgi:ABC-2 type transport system ATP-binding protein